jgi:hypothetical protein
LEPTPIGTSLGSREHSLTALWERNRVLGDILRKTEAFAELDHDDYECQNIFG